MPPQCPPNGLVSTGPRALQRTRPGPVPGPAKSRAAAKLSGPAQRPASEHGLVLG